MILYVLMFSYFFFFLRFYNFLNLSQDFPVDEGMDKVFSK